MEGSQVVVEDKIYVTVSKEIEENRSNLTWALQNSGGKKVCIVHVHQPADTIPTPNGIIYANTMEKRELRAYRENEREKMTVVLGEYLYISRKSGARVEKLYIEADSIEKGIVQLIEQHKIESLVMGAAADKQHSRRMEGLKSEKARYVRQNAPPFCHIWFVCNGYLIQTREGITPPRSSAVENEIAVRSGGSGREFVAGRLSHSQSSPKHPSFISQNESGKASGLESLYTEECMRRKQTEAELARVKEELEWMRNHAAELSKKNEELVNMTSHVAELDKMKADLEFMKSHGFGEVRSVIEQKELLETQVKKATLLLQKIGEKLASTINLVNNYGDL